jgi:hypothetical protein
MHGAYAKFNSTTVPAGSTVLFRSGETFNGLLQPSSGTSGNVVTYGKYGGNANPVISGFTTLTTWNLASGNIYWASLSFSQVQMVTLDGQVKGIGRYPNNGYLTYTSHWIIRL